MSPPPGTGTRKDDRLRTFGEGKANREYRCPYCHALCDSGVTLDIHARYCEKKPSRKVEHG